MLKLYDNIFGGNYAIMRFVIWDSSFKVLAVIWKYSCYEIIIYIFMYL